MHTAKGKLGKGGDSHSPIERHVVTSPAGSGESQSDRAKQASHEYRAAEDPERRENLDDAAVYDDRVAVIKPARRSIDRETVANDEIITWLRKEPLILV